MHIRVKYEKDKTFFSIKNNMLIIKNNNVHFTISEISVHLE